MLAWFPNWVRGDEAIAAPDTGFREAESSLPSAFGWTRFRAWKSHLRSDWRRNPAKR
jgi:hypothetical protein